MRDRRKNEVSVGEIRRHARLVLRFRARKCANCSYDSYVEVCHVKPIAQFDAEATLSEINDPKNLVLLCPNCHKQLDSGHLVFQEEWTNLYDDYEDFEE
jgi:5-methylcytosine-specific restriction endonuclease McrA